MFENFSLFFAKYFSGGLVFYGGLAGGIAGAVLTARYFKLSLKKHFPVLVPALILFSAFGRVGCFLTGCCYGAPTSSALGVHYPAGGFAPQGEALLPVQLFEAGADMVLFFAMVFLSFKKKINDHLLDLYIPLYALIRFVLEFYRGDKARGYFGILSTSQWISLAAVLGSVVFLLFRKFRKRSANKP